LGALERIPILRNTPWFIGWLSVDRGHDSERQLNAGALTPLKKAIMLHVNFQYVLYLENLAHPGRTQICEILFCIRLISVQLRCCSAQIFADDSHWAAVYWPLRFFAVVFLH